MAELRQRIKTMESCAANNVYVCQEEEEESEDEQPYIPPSQEDIDKGDCKVCGMSYVDADHTSCETESENEQSYISYQEDIDAVKKRKKATPFTMITRSKKRIKTKDLC